MKQEQITLAAQIRAGRGLCNLSQAALAEAAGMSSMTVKRAEGSGSPYPAQKAIDSIRAALEVQGIQFLEDGQIAPGPGVAMRKG